MTKSEEHLYFRSSDHYVDGTRSVSVVHERGRGIAWRIWPGAHVLLDWLEKNLTAWKKPNCHCVDIGAGVGLVGVVCAALGADHVTLTDLPEELEALKRSVASNHESVKHRLNVLPLTFGGAESEVEAVLSDAKLHPHRNLVIVGSELIYWESLFEPIAMTLKKLVVDHNGIAFIGYRKRVWKTEKRFFTKVLKQFGLDCQVLGQWMAVEEDGASQTTDGNVVYTDATSNNNDSEPEWNTRVYKIFPDPKPISHKDETQRVMSPQIVSPPSSPAHKDKKKHKIVHKEKKGRAR